MRVKLIRDKAKVRQGTVRPANSLEGRVLALGAKLHEEVAELLREPTDVAEYGDVLELIIELARINNVRWTDVLHHMEADRQRRGAFREGKIWTRP